VKQPPLLDHDPSVRRAFDYYPTPAWMTRALLKRVHPFYVFEPCAGDGAIANVIGGDVVTNDLDPRWLAHFHLDMTRADSWETVQAKHCIAWGVTNVPFHLADQIVPLAVARLSHFATILRLSWLEPTASRQTFLSANPPSRLIVMPRHDFKGRGQTDSVTSAWFIWDDNRAAKQGIDIVTKDERDELIAESA
jgi:hypothetical protein